MATMLQMLAVMYTTSNMYLSCITCVGVHTQTLHLYSATHMQQVSVQKLLKPLNRTALLGSSAVGYSLC